MNESCHTPMNESCHTPMNESCHTPMNESWMRHITHIWMNETCHTHMDESCYTYKWVTSCTLYEGKQKHSSGCQKRVMLHWWMSHVSRLNEYGYTYRWVISHNARSARATLEEASKMSQVTRVIESCHTYEWMSHEWLSHVACMNRSCYRVATIIGSLKL